MTYKPSPNGHIHIRVPDTEEDLPELIRGAADLESMTVSEWVRKTLRRQAEKRAARQERGRREVAQK